MLDELQHAKVCDFGLSRAITAKVEALQLGFQSVSHTTGNVGTLRYLAPEALRWVQTTSAKDVKIQYNERCDVYSFAMLLWELAHREVPFNGVDATQVALDVAPSGQRPELRLPKGLKPLGPLITSSWHVDPAQRPTMATCTEELLRLVRPAGGEPSRAGSSGQPLGHADAPPEQTGPTPSSDGSIGINPAGVDNSLTAKVGEMVLPAAPPNQRWVRAAWALGRAARPSAARGSGRPS